MAAHFRLIVGLGNPGREYEATRHNVGFMLVESLAAAAGAHFRTERKWRGEIAPLGDAWLCKPQTYMNLSGETVQALTGFYKIPSTQVLVIFDDMALPLGKLRLRPSGSAGGHNGLQSIINCLGTPRIPRLRIGIGAAEPGAAVGHVLGKFALEEREPLQQALARASQAVAHAMTHGLDAAMNQYN